MKKTLVVIMGLVFLLAGCTPATSKVPAIPPSGTLVTQPVKEKAAWEIEWEKVLAAAKKEGKVVLYTSRGADMREALYKVFTPKYGIELDSMSGKGNELSQKIIAERRADLNIADVLTTGATDPILNLKPAGALDKMDKSLILPEVTNAKLWFKGELPWADKEHTTFTFLAYESGEIGINTNLVKPGEIKTLQDLLNPKWKGKIILNDPTLSGTGSKLVGVLAQTQGWDFWRQLVKQEPIVLRDQRLQVEWMAQGKYAILIPPESEPYNAVIEAGAPLDRVWLEGVIYVTGDVLNLIKDAPHPNAAKVFINWLLSIEGQEIFSRVKSAQSAREDISVEVSRGRKPGLNYFDSNNEQFILNQAESIRVSKEIFGPLMK